MVMRWRCASFMMLMMAFALVAASCGDDDEPAATAAPTAAPGTQAPGTQAPGTQAPGTQAPGTQAPGTQAPGTQAPETQTSDPLVVLIDNDEGPITPANFNTFIGFWMVGWVYDTLFARSPDLEPVPALATEAIPSADGLTWEISLRDDVAFSYEFLMAAGRAPNLAAINTIEVTGDHSLSITLSAPAPFFIDEGLAGYYIMPQHIWEGQDPVGGELNQFQGSIGTGPFRIDEIAPGEFYTFSANNDYFRGTPRVETLIAKIVMDRTQQFSQLRTGAAQAVLASVPPAQVDQLAGDENIELIRGSDFFNYVLYANGSRAPFDDSEVRSAIAKAIDTATLTETIFLGRGTQLPLSWYHPDLPWSENIAHDFDPAEASRLLDVAGFVDSDGDGIRELAGEPASFDILCDANNPAEVRTAELIGGYLADVGIDANPDCIDIDTAVSRIWPNFAAVPDPDYDLAVWGWSAGVQTQRGFIRGLVDGDFGGIGWANLSGVADAELDALIAEFVTTPAGERSDELSTAIQQRFAAVLPYIPLMSPAGNFAVDPAAYDGWVYMRGNGIMTPWSFVPGG